MYNVEKMCYVSERKFFTWKYSTGPERLLRKLSFLRFFPLLATLDQPFLYWIINIQGRLKQYRAISLELIILMTMGKLPFPHFDFLEGYYKATDSCFAEKKLPQGSGNGWLQSVRSFLHLLVKGRNKRKKQNILYIPQRVNIFFIYHRRRCKFTKHKKLLHKVSINIIRMENIITQLNKRISYTFLGRLQFGIECQEEGYFYSIYYEQPK